jgi:hypothetical protein
MRSNRRSGIFEQAIALNPDDADSRYWIGAIKQKIGDIGAAQAAYVAAGANPAADPTTGDQDSAGFSRPGAVRAF